jgi:hypothetical protein
MFSLFKSKKTPALNRLPDKVWLSASFKWRGLLADIQAEQMKQNLVFLVYFFKDTRAHLEELIGKEKPELKIEGSYANTSTPIRWLNAHDLNYADIFAQTLLQFQGKGIQNITFLLTEHYPYLPKEEAVLTKIAEIAPQTQVCFYASLDESFFRLFGSERIQGIMKMLGLAEDEVISHAMIDKSIANAQQKISQKITHETHTDSAEAWFESNISQ